MQLPAVVTTFLKHMCLGNAILLIDGEPAAKEFVNCVLDMRHNRTLLRTTLAQSSQSNGAVESGIAQLGGQARTLKCAAEARYGVLLHPCLAVTWLPRHAAWLLNRFAVRASGCTPNEDACDSGWQGELAPSAETVLFQESVSYSGALMMNRRRMKADPRWRPGIYLGRAERTIEHILGTRSGVYFSRSVSEGDHRRKRRTRTCCWRSRGAFGTTAREQAGVKTEVVKNYAGDHLESIRGGCK